MKIAYVSSTSSSSISDSTSRVVSAAACKAATKPVRFRVGSPILYNTPMKTIFFVMLFCVSAFADMRAFTPRYAEFFRLKSYTRLQVIISTQPSWCYACKLYAPVVDRVANEMDDVDFIVNTTHNLIESPGYIPWTYIMTNDHKCRAELGGFVEDTELYDAIRKAQACEAGQ